MELGNGELCRVRLGDLATLPKAAGGTKDALWVNDRRKGWPGRLVEEKGCWRQTAHQLHPPNQEGAGMEAQGEVDLEETHLNKQTKIWFGSKINVSTFKVNQLLLFGFCEHGKKWLGYLDKTKSRNIYMPENNGYITFTRFFLTVRCLILSSLLA